MTRAKPAWMPDWEKLMAEAPEIPVNPEGGYLYLIADSHLGDERAPAGEFFSMLGSLPEARMVVFLGDLFRVWLGLPHFWDDQVREILAGFQGLRDHGTALVFVVGNREFFVPDPVRPTHRVLPFDHVVREACILVWGGHRYGFTHGDIVNRKDHRHLKWRRFSRGFGIELIFRIMSARMARGTAAWLERVLSKTNREIKVNYPLGEIEAFAETVMGDLEYFFLGHFHRDETVTVPGKTGILRIVPDWHSRKAVLRIAPSGEIERLHYSAESGELRPWVE